MNQALHKFQKQLLELEQKLQEAENLNKMLTRQMRELYQLYDITCNLNSTRGLRDIFRRLGQIFRIFFHTDEFAFFLYQEKAETLSVTYSNSLPKRELKDFFYQPNQGYVGKAFSTGKPIYLPNVQNLKNYNYFHLKQKTRGCVLYIPLKLPNNQVLGVLKMRKPVADSFSEIERNVLTTLGEQIAISIQNGLHYDEIYKNNWIDPTTNLYNKRYFKKIYDKEFKRAQRYQHPLSIIYLEITNFKELRRSFGTEGCEHILKTFASHLEGFTRSADICFYFDQARFLVLLTETSRRAAYEVLEKFIKKFDGMDIALPNSDSVATLSLAIGVSNYPKDTIEPPLLIKLAEQSLTDLSEASEKLTGLLSRRT